MPAVRDNKAQHRFELDVDGDVAFANYRITPAAVIITHTETPTIPLGNSRNGAGAVMIPGTSGHEQVRTYRFRWITRR